MIFPTITDRDEWNYLDTLTDFARVGYPHSPTILAHISSEEM
jgi:hypothetical protein